MTSHRSLFPPADDTRALEQLERLHREIQNARRRRERADAEFEGFVAGFHEDADEPRPRPAAQSRRPRASVTHETAAPREERVAAPAVAHTRSTRRPALVVAAAVALAGVVGIAYMWRTPVFIAPGTNTAVTPEPAPAVVLPHAEIESRPPLVPTGPASPARRVEIATVRAVWLRAIVDGHRAIERQVPAGERMAFTPSDSITIRAGDAGAVRVKIGGGPDEPLGRDGQAITRVFVTGSQEKK